MIVPPRRSEFVQNRNQNRRLRVTHLDPLQEEKEALKDVFQQLEPLRKRHHSHLVSEPEHREDGEAASQLRRRSRSRFPGRVISPASFAQ